MVQFIPQDFQMNTQIPRTVLG
ncbi:hypothetical protein Nmel_004751 [Mimus melanotis]